jgi:hypothetical protein
MSASFNCPHCGATVEYTGTAHTVTCQYCGTLVQAPAELWQETEQRQAAARWKKYIAIFLALTVGLPTCLGLFGAILGIGGSIFAVVLPFILRIFIH